MKCKVCGCSRFKHRTYLEENSMFELDDRVFQVGYISCVKCEETCYVETITKEELKKKLPMEVS